MREDLSRNAADAAAGRGAACGPPQRHDQSSSSIRCVISARRPRTGAHPDTAPPQTAGRCFPAPPACHAVGLDGKPVSPLGATSLQDLAAVRRAHPLEEPVAPLALAPVRLICPLHESSMYEFQGGDDNMAPGFGLSSLASYLNSGSLLRL